MPWDVQYASSMPFRFDLLRGISGAEKLAFPPAVRDNITEADGFELELLTGCPKSVFKILGHVLTYGKSWLAGETTTEEFNTVLDHSRHALTQWNASQETYPNSHPDWLLLTDAYRHTALLRIWRLPDPFLLPCTDKNVRLSVQRILDISAQLTWIRHTTNACFSQCSLLVRTLNSPISIIMYSSAWRESHGLRVSTSLPFCSY